MVTIQESGMTFGPFQEDQIYWIEKASAYKSLGQGIKSVEFVYKKNADKLFFIEAKSSCPKKKGKILMNILMILRRNLSIPSICGLHYICREEKTILPRICWTLQ